MVNLLSFFRKDKKSGLEDIQPVIINVTPSTNYHNQVALNYAEALRKGTVTREEFRTIELKAQEATGYNPGY